MLLLLLLIGETAGYSCNGTLIYSQPSEPKTFQDDITVDNANSSQERLNRNITGPSCDVGKGIKIKQIVGDCCWWIFDLNHDRMSAIPILCNLTREVARQYMHENCLKPNTKVKESDNAESSKASREAALTPGNLTHAVSLPIPSPTQGIGFENGSQHATDNTPVLDGNMSNPPTISSNMQSAIVAKNMIKRRRRDDGLQFLLPASHEVMEVHNFNFIEHGSLNNSKTDLGNATTDDNIFAPDDMSGNSSAGNFSSFEDNESRNYTFNDTNDLTDDAIYSWNRTNNSLRKIRAANPRPMEEYEYGYYDPHHHRFDQEDIYDDFHVEKEHDRIEHAGTTTRGKGGNNIEMRHQRIRAKGDASRVSDPFYWIIKLLQNII